MRTFSYHPALLDDVEVFHRTVGRRDDGVTGGVETQQALLHQVGQVGVFHLVERGKALEKLQRPLDVLQHRGFPCLDEGVRFFITITQSYSNCCGRICSHGRPSARGAH